LNLEQKNLTKININIIKIDENNQERTFNSIKAREELWNCLNDYYRKLEVEINSMQLSDGHPTRKTNNKDIINLLASMESKKREIKRIGESLKSRDVVIAKLNEKIQEVLNDEEDFDINVIINNKLKHLKEIILFEKSNEVMDAKFGISLVAKIDGNPIEVVRIEADGEEQVRDDDVKGDNR
jgi:hypothetical protein